MNIVRILMFCHSERSEESRKHKVDVIEILPPFGRLDDNYGYLLDQFIFACTDTDFFGMFEARFPFAFRCGVLEMVVMVVEIRAMHAVIQLASRHRSGRKTSIYASLVECQRVLGDKHTDVREDRRVVFRMAIAIRGDVQYQRDMEMRASVYHRLGIFRHLVVEELGCMIVGRVDGIEITCRDASSASQAIFGIHLHLHGFLVEYQPVVSALEHTTLASTALRLGNLDLSADVLVALAGTRAASHTNVLDGTSEARHFVSLEVVEADEHIGIHHGTTNLGLLYIFATHYRHFDFVRTLQAIANEDRATHGKRGETILPSTIKVFEGILSATRIEGVAIGQERLSAQFLHHFHHGTGIIRTEVGDVTQFPEMHLDGYKLAFKVEVGNARLLDEFLQFGRKSVAIGLRTEIGEIYFCFFHCVRLLVFYAK